MKKVTPAKVSSPVAMPFCTPSTKDHCPWYSSASLYLFSKVSFCLYFFVNKDMDISTGAFYPWKNFLSQVKCLGIPVPLCCVQGCESAFSLAIKGS